MISRKSKENREFIITFYNIMRPKQLRHTDDYIAFLFNLKDNDTRLLWRWKGRLAIGFNDFFLAQGEKGKRSNIDKDTGK